MTSENEVFYYVIARPWPDSEDGLCVYTYGTQLQRGTWEDAFDLRWYVREVECAGDDYDIYKITFEKL